MQEMAWQWIWSIFGSGAVAAVLLSIAGFLSRAQLAHWLNKDIEAIKARHQHDLANQLAESQRALETHKVGLIAEAERTRASQDVRKSIALMMAEKKFNALNRMHAAVQNFASEVLQLLQSSSPMRNRTDLDQADVRARELRQAMRDASMFFTPDEMESFYRLHNRAQGAIASARMNEHRLPEKSVEAQEQSLLPAQLAVNEIIARRLNAMLGMDE
ncbi:hypothetical protein FHY06_002789 [Variovorax sp. BK613]|nr:hypothetical protein [Variovorax sp. BK613]